MQHAFDYKQFIVLVVDDKAIILKYFTLAFQDQFRILTTTSYDEGLSLLKEHKAEVGVLIADSTMAGHKGVWLLEQARDIKPHLPRMLWSAYCGRDEVLEACRVGIHKFITLPFDPVAMEQTLRGALEQFGELSSLIGDAWQTNQVPRTAPRTAR